VSIYLGIHVEISVYPISRKVFSAQPSHTGMAKHYKSHKTWKMYVKMITVCLCR